MSEDGTTKVPSRMWGAWTRTRRTGARVWDPAGDRGPAEWYDTLRSERERWASPRRLWSP
ncbi:hypothetical protein [Microtetraspora glauca]|uniref:Uncharacterized protein n=1 Tax=Microtetraspora glauca TaxID=1996 RepID=A0ABV3GDH6_MICGL